jgi:hypothetical protein
LPYLLESGKSVDLEWNRTIAQEVLAFVILSLGIWGDPFIYIYILYIYVIRTFASIVKNSYESAQELGFVDG